MNTYGREISIKPDPPSLWFVRQLDQVRERVGGANYNFKGGMIREIRLFFIR